MMCQTTSLRETFLREARALLPPLRAATPRQVIRQAFSGLTAREREVAAEISRGKSNREIAVSMVVSERTVEYHVGNILGKLGLSSRSQVAIWAVEHGLASVFLNNSVGRPRLGHPVLAEPGTEIPVLRPRESPYLCGGAPRPSRLSCSYPHRADEQERRRSDYGGAADA